MSCTLQMMLIMPKLISSAMPVVAMRREFSAIHNRTDGTTDDAHDEGGNHRQFIATEGGLLMLTDELHSIQATSHHSHEVCLIVKRWFLIEE